MLLVEIFLIALLGLILIVIRKEELNWIKARMPKGVMERIWDGSERRRHVRISHELAVSYSVEKMAGVYAVTTKDLSERGMRILIDKKLERGVVLDLEIIPEAGKRPILLRGTVVWTNEARGRHLPSDNRLFHTGIRFQKISRETSGEFDALMNRIESALASPPPADGKTSLP